MRLLLAQFKHETNTFSTVPTPLERFFRGGTPLRADEAIKALRGTGTGIGGFIDVAERHGAQIVLPVAAEAQPSGLVDAQAFERISAMILDAATEQHFDGILLDLHGAMVTPDFEDGEGELLRRLREVQPETPIGITLDMHSNLYPDMVARVDVLTGYHTYPHIDMADAGKRAAELLVRFIGGEIRPVLAWGNRPMLPHTLRQGTHAEPNRSLQATCIELEQSGHGVLAASLFTGFPNADVRNAGLSVVVCCDADAARATEICEDLLDRAWAQRSAFLYAGTPLPETIARAKAAQTCPVVLLDHCDNAASGGSMDTTAVLREVLRQQLENAVFYAIHDPAAVDAAIAAGVGREVTLSIGGRASLAATGEHNESIQLSAHVRTISDGLIRLHGPMNAGTLRNTGRTVVLDTGSVDLPRFHVQQLMLL
ncbi:M81 family metallopeptidase [Alcaligenaceae bacterium]|nr:M81 family metallopeptidase [Alcaligenaceae bacterium]